MLQTLLTKSTRAVSENSSARGYSVPYVPFQNREDHKLAQAASHVIVGRRGVGKSTLIKRATELIRASGSSVAVVDCQAHSMLEGSELSREIIYDVVQSLIGDISRSARAIGNILDTSELQRLADEVAQEQLTPEAASPIIKRALAKLTATSGRPAFVFLDDFHLLKYDEQPVILHLIHGCLKGADGWLKVAGLRSLLNYDSPKTRMGMQVPGDPQLISLDLTLENPEQAEAHLHAILDSFLNAVGYNSSNSVLPPAAFKRLAWANAGVPRDFLQMLDQQSSTQGVTVIPSSRYLM